MKYTAHTYLYTYKKKYSIKEKVFRLFKIGRRGRNRLVTNTSFNDYFRIPKETSGIQYFY